MFRSTLAATHITLMNRLVLVSVVVVSVLLITVSGYSEVWTTPQPTTYRSSSTVQANQQPEVEVVTITADGFDPQEIVRPAGRFLLSVTNRSGLDSLNLRLENEQGSRLREKSLPLEALYWREVINPPRGRYVITEDNHPEWKFSLVIQ